MKDNFDKCLAITLRYEGAYSNHPDDPGGPTMRGITQREYDTWRKQQGKSTRSVRQLTDDEMRAIYRTQYWDAVAADSLVMGLDLCVFDAAVNSGVSRAQKWLSKSNDIDSFCDARLAFLQKTGRLWRVFGRGWRVRVMGVRSEAHAMIGVPGREPVVVDTTLHAGMRGDAVSALQVALRKLGYPIGATDGIFGEQTYRAVLVFQTDHDLGDNDGVWRPEYDKTLADASPMLPKRTEVTSRDLERAGDKSVTHASWLRRIFALIFGASTADTVLGGQQGLVTSIVTAHDAFEPLRTVVEAVKGHPVMVVGGVALVGYLMAHFWRESLTAEYRNFTDQGDINA